MENIFYIMKKT